MSPIGGSGPVTLVGGRVALILGAQTGPQLLIRFKKAVLEEDPVEAVFEALSYAGLKNLPSFACVIRDDIGIRLLLRGSVRVETRDFSGKVRAFEGEPVSTWAEHVIADPSEACMYSTFDDSTSPRLVLLFAERDRPKRAKGTKAATPVPPKVFSHESQPPTPRPAPPPPPPPRVIPAMAGPPAPATPRPTAKPPRTAGDTGIEDQTRVPTFPGVASARINPSTPDASPTDGPFTKPPPNVAWGPEESGEFDFSHLLDNTSHRKPQGSAIDPPAQSRVVTSDVAEAAGSAPTMAPRPEFALPEAPAFPGKESSSGLIEGFGAHSVAEGRVESAGHSYEEDDDDGDTIAVPRVGGLRVPKGGATSTRPQVQAVACVVGHLNPPHADRCRTCDAQIPDRTVRVADRPILGRLHFSDGLVVDMDRPLLIGRKPDYVAVKPINGESPGVVTLPDPDRSLSRIHLEVRIEDWQVLAVDRKSANNTFLEVPGEPAVQLRPNQPTLVPVGARLNLADVISFVYEVAPA